MVDSRHFWLLVWLIALAGCSGGSSSTSSSSGATPPKKHPVHHPEPPAQELPDLRIDSPMQSTGVTAGVSMHFDVVNDGAMAENIAWRVVRLGDDVVVGSGVIAMLDQGMMDMAMIDDPDGSDEDHYLLAVDPDNAIAESNEDNNSLAITAVGGGGDDPPPDPGKLDLRFDNAHYHGMYYYTDPIFHFWIQNVNSDGLAADDVGYTIRVDGDVTLSGTIPTIAANQEAMIFVHAPNVSVGHHTFEIFIDPQNDIAESNKGNNYHRAEVDCRLLPGPFAASDSVDANFQDPHFHGPFAGNRLVFHWFLRNHWTMALNDPDNPDDPTGHEGVDWLLTREGVEVEHGTVTDRIGPDALKEVVTTVYDPGDLLEAHYTLTLDPDGKIPETAFGETNNEVYFIVVLDPGSAG